MCAGGGGRMHGPRRGWAGRRSYVKNGRAKGGAVSRGDGRSPGRAGRNGRRVPRGVPARLAPAVFLTRIDARPHVDTPRLSVDLTDSTTPLSYHKKPRTQELNAQPN